MDLEQRFGCVIMASGAGKRFGGNKLMAPFRGAPLICRILDATEGLFPSRVVVTRHEDVALLCRERGVEAVLHDLPFRSDTVRLGLEAVGNAQGCLFCPGDQPLLRRETVRALMERAAAEPERILRPAWGHRVGAPVYFPRWCFAQLRGLSGNEGGGAVIKRHPEQVELLPVRDEYELMDVDTPQDLARLETAPGT
ncbi:MAG: nucleotidyltransferase family protein [Oscillospiraceae bacterium]|nr:nucleotidyltransferase family protein [Oscillospiraceae bacterium]